VLHSHNNFAGLRVTGTVSGTGKAAAATDRRKPFLRISFSVKTRLRSPSKALTNARMAGTKKAAAGDAAASLKRLFRQATV